MCVFCLGRAQNRIISYPSRLFNAHVRFLVRYAEIELNSRDNRLSAPHMFCFFGTVHLFTYRILLLARLFTLTFYLFTKWYLVDTCITSFCWLTNFFRKAEKALVWALPELVLTVYVSCKRQQKQAVLIL